MVAANGEMIFVFSRWQDPQKTSRKAAEVLGDVNILRIKNMFFLRSGGGAWFVFIGPFKKKMLQAKDLMVCRVFFVKDVSLFVKFKGPNYFQC